LKEIKLSDYKGAENLSARRVAAAVAGRRCGNGGRVKLWQAYEMGGSVACEHPSLKPQHSHAVLVATGEPLCKRVKARSLCWDASLLKDKPPTCPACLRAIIRLEVPPYTGPQNS